MFERLMLECRPVWRHRLGSEHSTCQKMGWMGYWNNVDCSYTIFNPTTKRLACHYKYKKSKSFAIPCRGHAIPDGNDKLIPLLLMLW
jgi:hypothetical protein